jgi:membrane-bound ClpP family serine protease
MTPLDLAQRRDIGQLLADGFRLWTRHFPVFFTLALVVVVPVRLLVDGVWGGTLDDWDATGAGTAESGPAAVSALCDALVIPVLVTAMHVIAVLDLGEGRTPSLSRSISGALRVVGPIALVVVLYSLAVGLGLVLLVIPGIWLSVKYYFGAQAVVVDGRRGIAALKRSSELVEGAWWATFGVLIVIGIVAFILGLLVAVVIGAPLGLLTDGGVFVAVVNVLATAIVSSFTALLATLYFFDLRARKQLSWRGDDPIHHHPERPAAPSFGPPGQPPASTTS